MPWISWFLAASLVACTGDTNALRQETKAITQLAETASAYWDAVRWGDLGAAAGFYESQETRLEWMSGSGAQDYRYRSAKVIRAEVSELRAPDDAGRIRDGWVYVQIQGYAMPEQILEQRLDTQTWYQTEAGWFVLEE